MAKKNTDYSGGQGDVFSNLRGCAYLGVPPEIGILIRCMDKFKRVESFVAKGTLQVQDESVLDSILDVINYMVLLHGMILEGKQECSSDQTPQSELDKASTSPLIRDSEELVSPSGTPTTSSQDSLV